MFLLGCISLLSVPGGEKDCKIVQKSGEQAADEEHNLVSWDISSSFLRIL